MLDANSLLYLVVFTMKTTYHGKDIPVVCTELAKLIDALKILRSPAEDVEGDWPKHGEASHHR